MATFGSNFILVDVTWTQLKSLLELKGMSLQYDATNPNFIQLFAIDAGSVVYLAYVYTGTLPASIAQTYSQAQNNIDLADFQDNYELGANQPIVPYQPGDDRWIYRLGNMTITSSTETLVAVNGYYEPTSAAQRSVKSTSANDNASGSGAQQVRIHYLDSNYIPSLEIVTMNGTSPVPTVGTNIRFIEKFEVVKGTSAAGRIILCANSAGAGEVCSIGAFNVDAFLCHHYVPSGSQGQTIEWDVTVNQSSFLKLNGQQWISGSQINLFYDLENIEMASGSTYNFVRTFKSQPAQEKTRVWVTTVPQQQTSQVIRARLNIWEDFLYVSGSS